MTGGKLSRECVYLVRKQGSTVLYFKRSASNQFGNDWHGPWEVVRQEGTARINIGGPNAHRSVLASSNSRPSSRLSRR